MDRLKVYSIERINGRFKKNKHLEWSDTSCLFSEIKRLKKELEDALAESCKYFDCSYREALKERD